MHLSSFLLLALISTLVISPRWDTELKKRRLRTWFNIVIFQVCGVRHLASLWVSTILCSSEMDVNSRYVLSDWLVQGTLGKQDGIWAASQPTEWCMDESDSIFKPKGHPSSVLLGHDSKPFPLFFLWAGNSGHVATPINIYHKSCLNLLLHFCDSLTHHLKGLFKFPSLAPIAKPIRYRMIWD